MVQFEASVFWIGGKMEELVQRIKLGRGGGR